MPSPSEHRDKTVEAVKGVLPASACDVAGEGLPQALVDAASPHLQRMYLERFREVVRQSREPTKAALGVLDPDWPSFLSPMSRADVKAFTNARQALEAALDKAQELMEEK